MALWSEWVWSCQIIQPAVFFIPRNAACVHVGLSNIPFRLDPSNLHLHQYFRPSFNSHSIRFFVRLSHKSSNCVWWANLMRTSPIRDLLVRLASICPLSVFQLYLVGLAKCHVSVPHPYSTRPLPVFQLTVLHQSSNGIWLSW